MPWPGRWTSTCRTTRWATTRRASRSTSATSGPRQREIQDAIGKSVRAEMFQSEYAEVFEGDEHWKSLPVPQGDLYRVGRGFDLRQESALFRRHDDRAAAGGADRGGAGAGGAGRQHHDRPHLAGRLDQAGQPGGPLPDRAGRQGRRLQLVRRPAGQRRGDGPRHVRQHPPAQQAGPGHRGRLDPPPARRRADDHLRRVAALPWTRACRC